MREFKPVEKRVLDLEDVRCDRCGETCLVDIGFDTKEPETAIFTANWGYGSSYDGQTWQAELCQDCATELKEWIDAGQGVGVLTIGTFGDISKEEAEQALNYSCSEWTGMSAEEFLAFRETQDIPNDSGFRQADWYASVIQADRDEG